MKTSNMSMGNLAIKFNENEYEEKMIMSDKILQDGAYQRPIDFSRVTKIANEFNPLLVNQPKISFRDGKYYVFDGQHTIAALKLRNGNRDLHVKCKVYTGLTQREEAILFSLQNGISRPVQSMHKMKARYTAGDTEVIELVKAINECGIKFDFTGAKADNKIVCGATVAKVFQKTKVSQFKEILTLVKEAWQGEADSFNREIIGGMYVFWKVYKDEYNHERAVERFGRVTPAAIIRNGKTYGTLKSDARFAMALVREYNKGTKGREHKLNEKEIWNY